MTGEEALAALVETLEQVRGIIASDKSSWDDNPVLRLAVERLWITAGNCAEEYRRASQIDLGVEPWAELVGYRNRLARALPGDLSTDRICTNTNTDLEPILAEVYRLH